jgi:hypothetical protein
MEHGSMPRACVCRRLQLDVNQHRMPTPIRPPLSACFCWQIHSGDGVIIGTDRDPTQFPICVAKSSVTLSSRGSTFGADSRHASAGSFGSLYGSLPEAPKPSFIGISISRTRLGHQPLAPIWGQCKTALTDRLSNPSQPMRSHLPRRNQHRCFRDLLFESMSPDHGPRCTC